MQKKYIIIIIGLFYFNLLHGQNKDEVWSFKSSVISDKISSKVLESLIPSSCLVEKSRDIINIFFTGRFSNYTKADTWYPSWASDGNLYSPWTDGTIGDMDGIWSGAAKNSKIGQVEISGDNPMNLEVENLGVYTSSALPYQGRYPFGSLIYNLKM